MGDEFKCFVGGLSFDTDDHSLKEAFGRFGEVFDAKVIMDRETGRSRGFGFVTFTNNNDMDRAIGEMDGQEVDGRNIRVNKSNPREGGKGKGGGKGGYEDRGFGGGKGGGYGGDRYGGGKGGGYGGRDDRYGGGKGGDRYGDRGGYGGDRGGYGGDRGGLWWRPWGLWWRPWGAMVATVGGATVATVEVVAIEDMPIGEETAMVVARAQVTVATVGHTRKVEETRMVVVPEGTLAGKVTPVVKPTAVAMLPEQLATLTPEGTEELQVVTKHQLQDTVVVAAAAAMDRNPRIATAEITVLHLIKRSETSFIIFLQLFLEVLASHEKTFFSL
ncbi:hypothetical protein CYMTET_43789 [Cymbomonas tetramitiformis]|uniref:RRM domain-containing protein n=1 Tax=Cymbomonas tetramitiformis TaxID=36881 RepID=A0AAE0EZM6_9CHLO|nr:hypothetical protein CYMTET_43789 [Cymbomonas tetramitiformis]